jgi:WD40 repeat protein/serine/threonine protein kinase
MPADLQKARELFLHAVGKLPPEQWDRYLAEACDTDAELHRQVAHLLQVHREAGSFLEHPAAGPEAGGAAPPGTELYAAGRREGPDSVIGPYKLLQEIGEGGMGTVYMAQQSRPVKRLVALKLIKPGMDSRQVVLRFEAERQALALMDHQNIARVFDAGATESGRPYFVMELVKGVPLTKYCDEHRLTPRQRLELFIPVCQAIQHAHQKGIIHRDVKPTNVLVALYDGKPVPKVIDFGVAKAAGQPLTERTLVTGFGAVVGTLEYMSPEQSELNQLDIDTRSDIYSLGVVLYELLTGSTPLDKKRLRQAAFAEVLRIIREEEPQKPSTRLSKSTDSLPSVSAQRHTEPAKLTRLVRGELDWIVMKALEKDRNRRYESASALAGDVQRYLNDEAVLACPPSAWYRFRKFARRNKAALVTATAVAAAIVLTLAGLAVNTILIAREQRVTAKALTAESKAKVELEEAVERERREAYFQRITVAHRELSTDHLAAALRALEACPEDLRGWEWHYLMRLCKVEPLVFRDKTEVNGVAFSSDGEFLASAGEDGAVRIWNSRTGDVVKTFNTGTGSVVSVAFHRDGKHLAFVKARQVKVLDWTTCEEVVIGPCDAIRQFGTAYVVAFSPDGRQLAAGSDGVVRVWDWENRRLLHTFPGHEHHSISVAFSRDSRHLATGSWQEGPRLWDLTTGGQPLRTFAGHTHPISALAFSPDGSRLASAGFDRKVKVWDSTTGRLVQPFPHTGNVDCVAFSPDGRYLASAGEDKTVRIWDPETGREVLSLRGHTDPCGCVTFSPDGRRLASASKDRTIRIWDATPLGGDEGQEMLTFPRQDHEIRCVAFSPDGRWIASAGMGTDVTIWDAATCRVSAELTVDTPIVFCLAWHPDSRRLACGGSDGRQSTVKVWDVRNRREAFPLPAGQEYFTVAFSADADGRYLVTGRLNGSVQVWDARTGQEVVTLGTHNQEIRDVVLSCDGRHLASASTGGVVKLWDATRLNAKQEARLTLRARIPRTSWNLAFSPDGQRLATGGENNTVKIWDVDTGEELQPPLEGHSGEVYTVAFSPDAEGRWIASAGEDSTVKVWDSHTGKLLRSFRGHTSLVSSVAFSPDGRRLVSGSRDTTIKAWDLTPLR